MMVWSNRTSLESIDDCYSEGIRVNIRLKVCGQIYVSMDDVYKRVCGG